MTRTDPRQVMTRAAAAYITTGLPGNARFGPVAVLPLRGKTPATRRGMLDACTSPDQIAAWWGRRGWLPGIGGRPPAGILVLDVDPRAGGHHHLAELEAEHGPLPVTLTTLSGRGDGGRHLWWIHPTPDQVLPAKLGPGLDLKTGRDGYVVLPPTTHPATGHPYTWHHLAPITTPPTWLTHLITTTTPHPQPGPGPGRRALGHPRPGGQDQAVRTDLPPTRARPRPGARSRPGGSPLERLNASLTWAQVLGPAGWRPVRGDGETDGSAWLHPAATSTCSATIRGGRLYVWTTNTVFPVSAPGAPHGLSKADALALLTATTITDLAHTHP